MIKPLAAATFCAWSLCCGAQVQQSTDLRAPVTAVALGPSRAVVEINVTRNSRATHHVRVKRPIVAVATPLRNVRIRIN